MMFLVEILPFTHEVAREGELGDTDCGMKNGQNISLVASNVGADAILPLAAEFMTHPDTQQTMALRGISEAAYGAVKTSFIAAHVQWETSKSALPAAYSAVRRPTPSSTHPSSAAQPCGQVLTRVACEQNGLNQRSEITTLLMLPCSTSSPGSHESV